LELELRPYDGVYIPIDLAALSPVECDGAGSRIAVVDTNGGAPFNRSQGALRAREGAKW
jgi:hypothetical protein